MNKMIIALICLAVVAADQSTIDYVNSLGTTWTAGQNPERDYASLCGDLIPRTEDMLPEKDIQIRTDIPASFDAAAEWPRCESIPEVLDQANCGSCWAFGAAEAVTDRLCIASGQTDQTRVSPQDMLACCGSSCGSCNGGYTDGAWRYYVNTGVRSGWDYGDSQWCYSYTFPPSGSGGSQTCARSCSSQSGRDWATDVNFGESSYSIPTRNPAAMQTEIMTYGSITASYVVYQDFMSYTGGVYQYTSGGVAGGHAIKITGWGTEGGVDYWQCTNSWGASWGDSGYFKIRRGTNECTIESRRLVAGHPRIVGGSFLE